MQKNRGGNVDNFGAIPMDDNFGALPMEAAPAPAKNGLQAWGNRNPNLARIPAAVAQGATDFANSIRGLVGAGRDPTNYYEEYGTTPNLVTDIAGGIISEAPYAVLPGALASKVGLMGASGAEWLARRGMDVGTGVLASHALSKGKGNDSSVGADIANGALYGVTGWLGEYLPMAASKIVQAMQKNKLPNEAIVEGNRAAEFPDVGNIVGNPQATAKWDDLTQSWFSPAKKTQEEFIPKAQGVQYANLQSADDQAMQLYKDLAGKPRIRPGEVPPATLQEAISNDLSRAYKDKSAQGTAYFKELEPEFNRLDIQQLPGAKQTAEKILKEAEDNATFGVTDAELKNDIIARANNAFKGQPTPERLALKKSLADNEHFYKQTGSEPALKEIERIKAELATPAYPVSQAIKEERNLSSIAGDLKARGDNNAARYYDMLANSYTKDINTFLDTNRPELLQQLGKARDFWKNNVIPFRESSAVRSLVNNTFDESEAALNLASTLTNGKHGQLMNILPTEAKNRIAADLLFKHGFNAVGDTAHLATDVAKSVNNIEPARLAGILGMDESSKLRNISRIVDKNAKILNSLDKSTKKVSSADGGAVADISTHGIPGLFARIGNSALNSATAPYWSRFLSKEANPDLLKAVANGKPLTLDDIRAMEAAQPTTFSPVRGAIANILSKPNATRIPIAGTVEGAKERKDRKEKTNGSR